MGVTGHHGGPQDAPAASSARLRTFSEATGGIATVGTNDFAGGFKRIVEDNSAYYVLGYHPAELKQDGKFHEISVKVKRPGVQVRARKGYYAPSQPPTRRRPCGPDHRAGSTARSR